MFKYSFSNDYDTKYKVRNREIACFSKSKMKDMYPDGNYNVIGETILNNSKDKIDEILLGKVALNVSKEGSHSKLLYKDAAYIYIYIADDNNNNKGGYVKLLKRRWFLLWLLLAVLLIGSLVYLLLSPKDIPDTPTPINPPQKEETEVIEKDTVYITLPIGTIEYDLISDISNLDGYDLSIEMKHDNSSDIIHSQKVKLNKDKTLENSELDFPSLTFELKVGNYEGKLIYTKDNQRIEYPADIKIRSANSGSMTISYSNEVIVNKSNNLISLNYKHDKDATNDVKLQIILLDKNNQETIIGESDTVKPGNSVSKLTLTNSNINTGTYDGYIRLIILTSDGSSTNVNTNIEVHITVK